MIFMTMYNYLILNCIYSNIDLWVLSDVSNLKFDTLIYFV